VRRDEPERAPFCVDWSAVYGVRDENFRVRDARVQFGESEDYFVTILGFRDHIRGHQFSAKLVSVGDARLSEQLLEQNAFVGFGLIFMGIRNVKSGAGHAFQVGGSKRERSGNRAANFKLRDGGRSLGYRRLTEWENTQEGADGD
jgi:hypothetical protein